MDVLFRTYWFDRKKKTMIWLMTLLLHSTINKYIASISVIIAWESVAYAGQVRIQLFRKLLEAKVSEEHYFLNIIHIYYAKWKNVRVVLNSLDCDMSFSYVYRDVNQFSNKFERIQEPCTSLVTKIWCF